MRLELLYNPYLLYKRLAQEFKQRQRLRKLKGTVASTLTLHHTDTLELLEIAKLHQPQVIYDIGANKGTWSLLARACYRKATIHAFEPLPAHVKEFLAATQFVPDITLHEVALGSKASMLSMQVTSFSDASSFLEVNDSINFVTKDYEYEVTVVVLDQYVSANRVPLPDLIKLDIQGYELEALRGAECCLKNAKSIICEVSFVEFYKEQALFHDLVCFLSHQGFLLHALGINTPLGQELLQTDALFTRRDC